VAALRRLPLDSVRLDRGLVDGVVESPRQRKITAGLLRMAGDLGLTSVAAGVDVPEQALRLREMGCTHAQGALFSGPLDEHRLRHALSRGAYPLPEPRPMPRRGTGRGPGRGRAGGAAEGGRSGVGGTLGGLGSGGRSVGGPIAGTGRGGEEQRRSGRSVVVAGALPVRLQERREAIPPWLASGSAVREGKGPVSQLSQATTSCSHVETGVPPT
jgi:hypothetical protein